MTDMSSASSAESSPIYRRERCGAIVHPANPKKSLAAWCARCQTFVAADMDGGTCVREATMA
jgi:hypothetical protein